MFALPELRQALARDMLALEALGQRVTRKAVEEKKGEAFKKTCRSSGRKISGSILVSMMPE